TKFSQNSQLPLSISDPTGRKGAPNVVVSMVTGPFLLGLIGARAIADGLTELGLISEEVFRGERLPILHTVPDTAFQNDDSEAE
ncbi:MAG: hypothetical protein AAFO87_09895, partial [Cyanobacteria bacterium J06607_6]